MRHQKNKMFGDKNRDAGSMQSYFLYCDDDTLNAHKMDWPSGDPFLNFDKEFQYAIFEYHSGSYNVFLNLRKRMKKIRKSLYFNIHQKHMRLVDVSYTVRLLLDCFFPGHCIFLFPCGFIHCF